jgi:NAD(P)-dependent dehydrogenase (short-subunit alcohol dehydrogenase family)
VRVMRAARASPASLPQVFVVTGANSGLGYETTLRLAERNALVVMAVRNTESGNRWGRAARGGGAGGPRSLTVRAGRRSGSRLGRTDSWMLAPIVLVICARLQGRGGDPLPGARRQAAGVARQHGLIQVGAP